MSKRSVQELALEYAVKVLMGWEYKKCINSIILYGSCARGDFRSGSDVDLFILCNEGIDTRALRALRTEVIPVDLPIEVDLHFGFKPLAESQGIYYRNIEKEGIVLWERVQPISV